MSMTYCTFTTLAKAKDKLNEQFKEDELILLLYKLADSFRKLQSIGIAHRDIKPDNLMINEDIDTVKIIDIGEADYSSISNNTELQAFGTANFAAPEIKYLIDDYDNDTSIN